MSERKKDREKFADDVLDYIRKRGKKDEQESLDEDNDLHIDLSVEDQWTTYLRTTEQEGKKEGEQLTKGKYTTSKYSITDRLFDSLVTYTLKPKNQNILGGKVEESPIALELSILDLAREIRHLVRFSPSSFEISLVYIGRLSARDEALLENIAKKYDYNLSISVFREKKLTVDQESKR